MEELLKEFLQNAMKEVGRQDRERNKEEKSVDEALGELLKMLTEDTYKGQEYKGALDALEELSELGEEEVVELLRVGVELKTKIDSMMALARIGKKVSCLMGEVAREEIIDSSEVFSRTLEIIFGMFNAVEKTEGEAEFINPITNKTYTQHFKTFDPMEIMRKVEEISKLNVNKVMSEEPSPTLASEVLFGGLFLETYKATRSLEKEIKEIEDSLGDKLDILKAL